MEDGSLRSLEFALDHPKTGAFVTISPGLELTDLIRKSFLFSFGEESGCAYEWLNNKLISKSDIKSLAAFMNEPEYGFYSNAD